jgi:pimeloyl-ACP methyl ester carboxylesterase
MYQQFIYQKSTISYRLIGTGKPVLLIHGFGEDSHIWDEQIAALENNCQLIIPDLPGTGKSDLLTNNNHPISIEDYATVMHQLLQHLQINCCIILGHSMGGYITLAFAEKYPSILTAFGLIHSTAFADSEEKKENRSRSILLIAEFGGYAFLKNTIPNLFSGRYKKERPEKLDELIESSKQFSNEALQQYTYAMQQRPDRTAVLQSCKKPVLFIIGTEDIAAPMTDVLQQVYLPEVSYIHILETTGHMGMWESTAQFNQHLQDFITAV